MYQAPERQANSRCTISQTSFPSSSHSSCSFCACTIEEVKLTWPSWTSSHGVGLPSQLTDPVELCEEEPPTRYGENATAPHTSPGLEGGPVAPHSTLAASTKQP